MPRIIIHPDGGREVAEEATAAPQVGAAPRLSDGTPIGADGLPMPTEPPPPPPARPRRARRSAEPAAPAPAEAPAAPTPAED
jgi:hypothetical protein